MPSEFDLIARYFTRPTRNGSAVQLGVGDDCALIAPPTNESLAISTDMLVEGRHFLPGADPQSLGHKALAVNLSDLAAMGARPLGFSLALALPAADEGWLASFARGLFALADQEHIELIGGDTTRGPLNICITVFGSVPIDHALRRDGARANDDVWVSGHLGDARLGLEVLTRHLTLSADDSASALGRLHHPIPRLSLGLALRGIASAAIDISDGLTGDLGHILQRSALGATIEADLLPIGSALRSQDQKIQYEFALNGGDDYELCFCAPAAQRDRVIAAAQQVGVAVTRIGQTTATPGLRILDHAGKPLQLDSKSFDHFSIS
ncbi:MAG: thiamine-phosphate kinase [Oxalobacteraceae bacterium]|nr:thiamine-phosphate kinase [Oxalobacteraceae bacterium]